MKLFYSPRYEADIGPHVFPIVKYRLTYEKLLHDRTAQPKDFLEPRPAERKDLLLVHTTEWVEKVLEGKMTPWDEARLELPHSPALALASQIAAGGTIAACREALRTGVGAHVGGGFQHAFPDHGEGFCVFNDIALGIRKMQQEKKISKAAVVD